MKNAHDDGDNAYNSHYENGDISHGCPSWAPILGFMGHTSAAFLANLGGTCVIHKNHGIHKYYSYNQKDFRTSMIFIHKFLKI